MGIDTINSNTIGGKDALTNCNRCLCDMNSLSAFAEEATCDCGLCCISYLQLLRIIEGRVFKVELSD